MIVVVDTHALIWYFEGKPQLSSRAKEIMFDEESILIVPVIVLCELLYYFRKCHKPEAYQIILSALSKNPKYKLVEIRTDHIPQIPLGLEMHDGLIAACLQNTPRAILLSRDPALKKWGKERVVW